MLNEQEFIDKARQELQIPTFELTKQYLAVLQIQMDNGIAAVARVNINHSTNLVAVYFKVVKEDFFVVVNVTKSPDLKIDWVWIELGHRVYLTATSEELDFSQLSGFLTLTPLTGWSKGDLQPNNKMHYKFSRVSFELNKELPFDLEEKLEDLVTALENDSEGIINLSKVAYISIVVYRYQYVSGNAGIELTSNMINRLAKLNLGISFDQYISGKAIE
ncbi:MAG TPA: DUF4279 domain-containing protein [Chitinophagales bacterium]|nr:DUF4279 domain-containing protein [Chitinophagales bacterium]